MSIVYGGMTGLILLGMTTAVYRDGERSDSEYTVGGI